jgi:glycosyltransferase involved in cell wall biosynthesis
VGIGRAGALLLMKILIVCERLAARDDEGIRNVARALLAAFSKQHEVRALTRGHWPGNKDVIHVPMNRFFWNLTLLRNAREFAPDVTLYVPWTSGTPPTFFRGRMLQLATGTPVAIFLSQPYEMPAWQKFVIRRLLPGLVLAMSDNVIRQLAQLGAETEFVPAGVDLGRFRPPLREVREDVREELGIGPDERFVLHVGHLNRRRMDSAEVARIARRPGHQMIVVGSTSTPQDTDLVRELEDAGARVISEFLPEIEKVYGAADVYLFPTRDQRSCIGVPLSVLEALACGTPVVSTRFEGLPRLFPATPFVQFVSSDAQMDRALDHAPPAGDERARKLVEELDWRVVSGHVERHLNTLQAEGRS